MPPIQSPTEEKNSGQESLEHPTNVPAHSLSTSDETPPIHPPLWRDLPLNRTVWALALPSVTTMLLQTVNSLMDTFFVGHLPNSAQTLSATGVGGGINFLLISVAMGVSVGTTALVARFTGAKDSKSVVLATGQSMTLAAILGAIFCVIFYLIRYPLINVMLDGGKNPIAAGLCVSFVEMTLIATIPQFVLNVINGAFRGVGDTRTPMYITLVQIVTHITTNYLLIYGNLGFPRLGVKGAGVALCVSIYVATALYLFALKKKKPFLSEALHLQNLTFNLEWAKRIMKIGIPASIQAVIRTLGMMSFTGMLAHTIEGAAGVAALQIGIRAEAIAFMPGFGYSVAASALVGQSLGAKKPEMAERYGWAANGQAMLVMAFMAIIYYVFADRFASLFTTDMAVHRLGVDYLRISAPFEIFLALGMVLTGALQGAGDTIRPTIITFVTMWVLRIPIGILLMFVLHMNTHGAWWAMNITTVSGGVWVALLFKSGKWKKIKV